MAHKSSVDIPIRLLFEKSLGLEFLESELVEVTKLLAPFNQAMKLNIDLSSIKSIDQLIAKLNEAGVSAQALKNKLTLSVQNPSGIMGSVTISKNAKGDMRASEAYTKETLTLNQELITVYQQLETSIRRVQSLERQGINSGEAYRLASTQVKIYRTQLDELIARINEKVGATNAEAQADMASAKAIIKKRNADIQLLEATHQATLSQQQQKQTAQEYLSTMSQLFAAEVKLHTLQQGGAPHNAVVAQQQLVSLLQNRAAQLKSVITDEQLLKQIEEQLTIATAKRNAQMQQGTAAIRKQQSVFGSLIATMKMVAKTALLYSMAYGAIYKVTEAVTKVIDTVEELDKEVVNLQIVTGKSREEAQELLITYSKMAQTLGSTTSQVAEAAVEWQRQGYSIADTNKLIENSMILSKVGMLDSAEAQKYLTSAMKGYNVSVQDSIRVVDQLTKIDMSAAVSAGGLAEAMSKTANSANLAGVEMEQLLGYLAVVGETTQKSMSSVGESKIIDALKVA